MTRGVLFLYAIIILNILVNDAVAHICDVCDCQPSRMDAFSISCTCESTKYLHLTPSSMMGLQSTAMVVIKNCETVNIEKNSFFQLGKLDTLGIQNCGRLYLETGAFANLNSLLINGVKDIFFGEMAFMGARGIRNLNIRGSNITELPLYSFFDVTGMDSFALRAVNISRIQKNAVNISANSVTIDNSIINEIESEGVSLKALKVIVRNSEIVTAAPGSINIRTEYQTRLLENRFKDVFEVNIKSPFAEFFRNSFDYFNSSILSNISTPRMMYNFFKNVTFESLFERFNPKDFYDNHFTCKCNMNLFNYTRNSVNYEILRKNYCLANCTVSLYDFESESLSTCFKEKNVNANTFCKNNRAGKSLPEVVTTTASTKLSKNNITLVIEPRFLNSDEVDNTTEYSGSESLTIKKVMYLIIVGLSWKLLTT